MSLTNAYCTLDDVKEQINVGDTDDDGNLEIAINSASRQIDAHCGRPHGFWQDTNVATRVYDPEDDRCCFVIDDISTTTGLIVKTDSALNGTYSTTLTLNTHFILKPNNALADGLAYDRIVLLASGGAFFQTADIPYVQVTAKFGFAAIPVAVKEACVLQARRLFKASPFGVVGVEDGFGIRLGANLHPDAAALLRHPYVRLQ